MSTAACGTHSATLAGRSDLAKQFVADVRGRVRPIRGRIRHFVIEEDGFGLREDDDQAARLAEGDEPEDWPDPPNEVYEFTRDSAKANAFVAWLRRQLRDRLLGPVRVGNVVRLRNARRRDLPRLLSDWDHWTAEYLRGAARMAWETAGSRLRSAGVEIGPTALGPDDSLVGAFDIGARPETLRKAYTRTYENLESIADDAAAQTVRETITKGIADGVHPRKMARDLTGDVRSLQRRRAETLARTETQSVRADSTLDRLDAANVDAVQHGEWSAADDQRTCPICSELDGRVFTIGEMRTGTFTFDPGEDEPDHLAGEYSLKPPTHCNCRCSILPSIDA